MIDQQKKKEEEEEKVYEENPENSIHIGEYKKNVQEYW